uniref:Uncharacterized protein n=1 Tax=Dicentrarchus labrax TaxID=13489 RepID=A0A8P4KBD0_DICLA
MCDLVKSHLMLAVREEVELLKEQIRELQERNQQLERENHILRTLTHNIHTEKLPFKRQKPRTDPSALGGWSSALTSWGERDRGRETGEQQQQ